MGDVICGIIIGAIGGFLLALASLVSTGVVKKHTQLKEECELNLPRSQVCVMQLVPKK